MSDEILDQASQTEQGPGAKQRRTRWLLWLQWVLVSAVGLAFVAWAFVAWASEQGHDRPVDLAVVGLSAVCVAFGQWLVLRPRLARAGWWVLVTPVGLGLGGLAGLIGIWVGSDSFGWPDVSLGLLATLLIATPLGLLQWLVLRGQMRHALWWLPVTVIATIGIGILFLWRCLMVFPELPAALGGFVAGAAYGAVTGVALVMFLPRPPETRDGG